MAGYPGARRIPALLTLRQEFRDQSASIRYHRSIELLSRRTKVPTATFVNDTISYLTSLRAHSGVEDLLRISQLWIRRYRLPLTPQSQLLYQAIKALPSVSRHRIGYTFQRRRPHLDRGVFVFLAQ